MIKILFTVFIYACIFNFGALKRRGAKEIFDMTADDIIDAAIGLDEFKKRHENMKQNLYKKKTDVLLTSLSEDDIQVNVTNTAKPTRKNNNVTMLPEHRDAPVSIEETKMRLRHMEVLYLLKNKRSVIPDFKNDGDDPEHITRQFDHRHASNLRRSWNYTVTTTYNPNYFREILRPTVQETGNADVYILDHHGWMMTVAPILTTNRVDKNRLTILMRQFVYMTRYKISVMAELRKKYKSHLKYQIGYCFALLRLVRNQQKTLYSSLMLYNDTITNAVTQIDIYRKILRQHVDIKDIVRFVKTLNHAQKLKQDPTYYDDEPQQKFKMPEIKLTNK